jgi:RNA polymerase sigma-70 factor (ECF subfamily)
MSADAKLEQDLRWRRLMAAAQAGETAAYEQLLREALPFIRALARRYCATAHDLEDALQDTLLTVHRVRHTYDPRQPFGPWLAAITSRRCIDGLRRRTRTARHEAVDESGYETFADVAANDDIEDVHAAGAVRELVQQLPPQQRAALEAVKLRELSMAEAAAASGQSVGAVKVNVHRALKTLRALFRERERSGPSDGSG